VQEEVEGALVMECGQSDPWFAAVASNAGAWRSTGAGGGSAHGGGGQP
jgi:hypothetical protein